MAPSARMRPSLHRIQEIVVSFTLTRSGAALAELFTRSIQHRCARVRMRAQRLLRSTSRSCPKLRNWTRLSASCCSVVARARMTWPRFDQMTLGTRLKAIPHDNRSSRTVRATSCYLGTPTGACCARFCSREGCCSSMLERGFASTNHASAWWVSDSSRQLISILRTRASKAWRTSLPLPSSPLH
jgi:hypothetical protein